MLLEEGWTVASFSRGRYPELEARGVACHTGDLADGAAVNDAFRNADVVFHVAARAGIWGEYAEYHAANVVGTQNVIQACRQNGVRKLVYTSTPSVVMNGRDIRNGDENLPLAQDYLCHYAATKAQAERLVLAANGPDLATVALRPHIIWGPGDNQILPRLAEKCRAGRLWLIGHGDNLVDTVFVDNAAKAHLDAARCLEAGAPPAGRVYFVSQGDPRPVRSILNEFLRAASLPPVTESIPVSVAYATAWLMETCYRIFGISGDPPLTRFFVLQMAREHYFDISAARKDLGYSPAVSIEEGMERLRLALAGDPVLSAESKMVPDYGDIRR
jgi:nucleoside-diphosphate-sugar epimerase